MVQLLGAVSAVLIVAGALSPLDLPLIDDANFIGYVLWSVWLVDLRGPAPARPAPHRHNRGRARPC